MQIDVVTPKYPGKIWRDEDFFKTPLPKRISLTDRALSTEVGLPRALVKKYLKSRVLHELKPGEKEAGFGFCAEELAGLIITAELHTRFQAPFGEAKRYGAELTALLSRYPTCARVILMVCSSNSKNYVLIQVGPEGPFEVDPQMRSYLTVFDASVLTAAVEASIQREGQLRLPRASSCVVQR